MPSAAPGAVVEVHGWAPNCRPRRRNKLACRTGTAAVTMPQVGTGNTRRPSITCQDRHTASSGRWWPLTWPRPIPGAPGPPEPLGNVVRPGSYGKPDLAWAASRVNLSRRPLFLTASRVLRTRWLLILTPFKAGLDTEDEQIASAYAEIPDPPWFAGYRRSGRADKRDPFREYGSGGDWWINSRDSGGRSQWPDVASLRPTRQKSRL